MPVLIYDTGSGGTLIITCDQCGQRITSAAAATCYWPRMDVGATAAPSFVHKKCHRDFDLDRDAKCWPTAEAGTLLAELIANAGMSAQEWIRAQESMCPLDELDL